MGVVCAQHPHLGMVSHMPAPFASIRRLSHGSMFHPYTTGTSSCVMKAALCLT